MSDEKVKKQESGEKETNTQQEKVEVKKYQIKKSIQRAAFGGGLAGIITFIGAWIIGGVSGSEAFILLQSALPAARSFAANILLATGTILALMLTLLSFSYNTKVNLKWTHYQRVKHIALTDACTLVASVLIFLLLNIPLEESDQLSPAWYSGFYYASLILSSVLGGAIITVVLMLYDTIRDIIEVIKPGEISDELQSRLIQKETEE